MNVLVAYNGLETGLKESQYALEEAVRVAEQYGLGTGEEGPEPEGRMVLLSVEPPGQRMGAQKYFRPPSARDDATIGHAFLREHGVDCEMKLASGDPADEIIREATEGGYDLLILGRRDLGPVGRLVLGSVSRKVAKHAPCTVVIASEGRVERIEPASA